MSSEKKEWKRVRGCMGLDCSKIEIASSAVMAQQENLDSWNVVTGDTIEELNAGKTLFAFACRVGASLSPADKHLVATIVNLSAFDNEEEENNVPIIDPADAKQQKGYTVIITKTAYLVPRVHADVFTTELMTRPSYHVACQPGSPAIEKRSRECPDTVRMTKTIIPVVFKITLQLKTSLLSEDDCINVGLIDGFKADRGILMERTKRNKNTVDATRKVKSVLLINEVPGGVLLRNTVIVYNTAIPSYAASVINNLGTFGAAEAYQTAQMTRYAVPKIIAGEKDFKPYSDPNSSWTSGWFS